MKQASLVFLIALFTWPIAAWCDELARDAAIGGGVGGAVGGAIGAEVGDREGAIVGSAVGAAVGTAIATEDKPNRDHPDNRATGEMSSVHSHHHPQGYFCPPGQAKKGRC